MSHDGREARIDVVADDGSALGAVSAHIAKPKRSKATVLIAHGAGGTKDTPSIVSLAEALADKQITSVRFNFLYTEKGRRSPDKQPTLTSTWRSVADWARAELRPKRLFLAGRSMGGRMASYLAADGYGCDGLIFLAYPLHPPGKQDRLRKDHLPGIGVPMLFVSGTRDSFAELSLLEPIVRELDARLLLLEGADHGFRVPKKYGRSTEEVDEAVLGAVVDFVSRS